VAAFATGFFSAGTGFFVASGFFGGLGISLRSAFRPARGLGGGRRCATDGQGALASVWGLRLITLAALLSFSALAAPAQPPTVYAPARDGGWSARPPYLRAQYTPSIPLDVNRFEFEVESPPGTLIASQVVAVNRASSASIVSWYAPSPPDAGLHFWRARSLDVDGGTSPWMAWESFRIDDGAPPYPATVTLDARDAGWVSMSCDPVSDNQSGVTAYHWMFGQLDMADGGVGATFSGPTSPGPSREFRLGPGQWMVGAHAHDAVGNGQSTSARWVPVTGAPPSLGAPPPVLVTQSNGMPWPNPPYQNVNRAYFRFPAQAFDAGAFTVIQTRGDGGVWGFSVDSVTSTANVYQSDGRLEFRYAAFLEGASTEWSAPVVVWVDATAPFSTGQLDGGRAGSLVSLSWAPVTDANPTTTGSGLAAYEVTRAAGDAGAVVATVLSTSPLEVSEAPPPGRWTYFVHSRDRALNRSADAGRITIDVPPAAPGTPQATTSLSDAGVELTWAWPGEPAEFELDRVDADGGAVVLVQLGLASPQLVDAPPEGRWRYAARAVVREAMGPTSPLSGVVTVDRSGPVVDAPVVERVTASALRLQWTAVDALSAVATVRVERETGGVVTSLGPASSSPLQDTPPDGSHRYRVIADDEAGNETTSAWSAAVETPLVAPVVPTLVITPPALVHATCGAAVDVTWSAQGDAPVRWSLLEGPPTAQLDEATGTLTWTPGPEARGAHLVRVQAAGPSARDEATLTVDVTCERTVLGVGCGCSTVDASWLSALALALLRRRRARRSATAPQRQR